MDWTPTTICSIYPTQMEFASRPYSYLWLKNKYIKIVQEIKEITEKSHNKVLKSYDNIPKIKIKAK